MKKVLSLSLVALLLSFVVAPSATLLAGGEEPVQEFLADGGNEYGNGGG